MNSVLESLVTALLGTLMADNGNLQGGTAGGREGRTVCHLPCWKEGLSCQRGVGWRMETEKASGGRRFGLGPEARVGDHYVYFHYKFTFIWTFLSKQGLPGADLGLINKVRSFSLVANLQEKNKTQEGAAVVLPELAMVTGPGVASKSPVCLASRNPFFFGLEPRRG